MSRVSRFLNLLRERALEQEFDEELRCHLDMRIERNVGRGMSHADAEAEARRHLGNTVRAREGMREARVSLWLEEVGRDCRHALRVFRHRRHSAALVVLMLSLAVGANASLFAVLRAALIRPLPFDQADRLIRMEAIAGPTHGRIGPTIPEVLDIRSWSRNFEMLSFFDTRDAQIAGGSEPVRVFAARVESALLPMLGAVPGRGRVFVESDSDENSPAVALLTEGLWRRNFDRDPQVVGRSLIVNGVPHDIVGILPADVSLDYLTPEPIDLFLPYPASATYRSRTAEFTSVRRVVAVGRTKRGLPVSAAAAELEALSRVLATEYPGLYPTGGQDAEYRLTAVPLRDSVSPQGHRRLMLLLGVVVLVLLMACANTAQYLVAQSIQREPEVALRRALGAERTRLVRQFLAEAMVLALPAAAFGLFQATWWSHALLSLVPDARVVGDVGVDVPVLAFTTIVVCATVAACGLVPALTVTESSAIATMSPRVPLSRGIRTRHMLVATQVAIAVVLLLGTGHLLTSLREAQLSPHGFTSDAVDVMRLRGIGPPGTPSLGPIYERYLDQIARIPGIEVAAVASAALPGPRNTLFSVPGAVAAAVQPSPQTASYQIVSPGYFAAIRIPILEGRPFDTHDGMGQQPVAMVNQELARRLWPGQRAIGRLIRAGEGPRLATMTVVGVVGNVRPMFQSGDVPQIYVSHLQQSEPNVAVLIRRAAPSRLPLESVKRAIWSVEPRQAVFGIQSLDDFASAGLRGQRTIGAVLAAFALLAVVMSVIGAYSVISFVTSRRAREMALRRAVGATTSDVFAALTVEPLRWAVGGLVMGVGVAVLGRGVTRVALEGAVTWDIATIGLVMGPYLAVVAFAMWIPAFRLLRSNPVAALRDE